MWKSNDPQWKSLEPKKKIFRTSIFAVCSERFQSLRTGAELDFITLSSWDWVNVIARTEDGKILLIRQFRPGTMQNEIEIPGGCIDPSDPSPEAAAERELLEETGYAGINPRIIGTVSPNPAIQGNLCYTVFIDRVRQVSEPGLEDTETIETAAVPEQKIREMIAAGEIRHGLVLNALFFYLTATGGKTEMNGFTTEFSTEYADACKVHDALYSYNLTKTGFERVEVHAEKFPGQQTIVVKDPEGNFAGGLVFHPTENHSIFVDYFFMESICRGKGLGEKVMQELEQYARKNGVREINLTTSSFQAPGFYQKMGFVITHEKPSPTPASPDNIHYSLTKKL